MLEVGKKRATGIGFTSKDLSWKEGDAQELPFEDNTFDAYTISFGIRNVVDVQKVSACHKLQILQELAVVHQSPTLQKEVNDCCVL